MEKAELFKAISKLQGELPTIEKNKKVNTGKYGFKYADLSAIHEALREPLSRNGLSIMQPLISEGDVTYLFTILAHESGQSIESKVKIEHTGQNIQQLGGAITYHRRYAISSMLGIVSDDDVDDVASVNQTNHPYAKPAFISEQQVAYLQKSAGHPSHLEKLLLAVRVSDICRITPDKFDRCVKYLHDLKQQPQPALNGVNHG